jgi:hypothetical protein
MQYPHLQEFLHSWFHQDFDINGQTIPKIITLYKNSTPNLQVMELIQDIQLFLEAYPALSPAQLMNFFDMEVDPLGFAESARSFLSEIKNSLLIEKQQ